jgi:hypothetical protein
MLKPTLTGFLGLLMARLAALAESKSQSVRFCEPAEKRSPQERFYR